MKRPLLTSFIACVLASGCSKNDSPIAGPVSGTEGVATAKPSIFSKILGRDKCTELAGAPLEGTAEQPGPRLDYINAPEAISACKLAVERSPSNGAHWRHLYRAYKAGVTYGAMDQDATWPLAVEAIKNAAVAGDVTARVYMTIFNIDSDRQPAQIAADAKALAAQIQDGELKSAQDRFAYALLKAAPIGIEGNRLSRESEIGADQRYYRVQYPIYAALFDRVGREAGYTTLEIATRELQVEHWCRAYMPFCYWSDNVILDTKDPNVYLGIAAISMTEAFRQIDLGYAKSLTSDDDRHRVNQRGDSWAGRARSLAQDVQLVGNNKQKAAAQQIEAAYMNYQEYSNQRFQTSAEDGKRATAEAWAALGALLVAGIAMSEGKTEVETQTTWDRNTVNIHSQICREQQAAAAAASRPIPVCDWTQ